MIGHAYKYKLYSYNQSVLPKMFLAKYFLAVALVVLAESALVKDDNIVAIRNGLIRGGLAVTVDRRVPYYFYRGIPYAEPPVGERRFEPPVPKGNWDGIFDATKEGSICLQREGDALEGSEDCLSINVYTPQRPQAETCVRRPTFVWIYGGGFQAGNSTYQSFGPDHILEQDVVVVTFNYRLGLLGFLSTGDSVAPGNNGLKDQVLALRWVRDNIEAFCGDPNKITIGGQSAGAASVSYHLQSPLSRGLFQRAIVSSGTSLSLWALSRNVPDIVKVVAEELQVDTSSSRSIVDGLKTFNVTYLLETASPVIIEQFIANNPKDGMPLGPVIEPEGPDAFFSHRSHEGLVNGNFARVPVLIGFNSMEGTFDFDGLIRMLLFSFDLQNAKLIPASLNVDPKLISTVSRSIKRSYFGLSLISLSEDVKLMEFLSDDQFIRGTREFVKLIRDSTNVYLYRFSYEGGLWGVYQRNQSGVTHSEELGYYWRSYFEPAREHDLVVKERLVTLFTNFIHHGNPTPIQDPALQDVIWPTSDARYTYLDIGEDLSVEQEPEQEKMEFWDGIFSQYGQPPFDTY